MYCPCCLHRPAHLVLLVLTAQTSQHHPSHVQMDLTVWVLQPFVLNVQLVITVKLTGKTLFHYPVLLASTATNLQLLVPNATLGMHVKAQILLQPRHLAYAHLAITALMASEKCPAHQVHMVTLLVQLVRLEDVHHAPLDISVLQQPEVIPLTGLCLLNLLVALTSFIHLNYKFESLSAITLCEKFAIAII